MANCEPPVPLSTWSPALAPARRAAALGAARDVGSRVTERDRIEQAIAASRKQTHFPMSVHWDPSGVAQGDAGLALLCAYLDRCFPDEHWDVIGHDFLASAAAHAERSHLGPGLYNGIAGLGFVASQLSRDGTRYTRLSRALDGALASQAVALADSLKGRNHGVSVGEFDAISGLSGIGAYLLTRRNQPHVAGALDRLLEALVDLTTASADGPPRWFTPVEFMFDETTTAMYPDGHLNCGLAHGIPGPLAVMALALAEGHEVRGHARRDRIDRGLAVRQPRRRRLGHQLADDGPPARRLAPLSRAEPSRLVLWEPRCRARTVAGGQSARRRAAHDRRLRSDAGDLPSPTARAPDRFAHLLPRRRWAASDHTALRARHRRPGLHPAVAALTEQLLDAYDPDGLLGFCSIEPGGNDVDQAGLLDGAPGVALVLLAAAIDAEPTWDRLFLLA